MAQDQTNYKILSGKSVLDIDDQIYANRFTDYRNLWQNAPRQEIVTNFPLNVDVELTNACNLRCPHCARTHDNWGCSSIGFMDIDLATKIIKEINQEQSGCIKFSLRGEPLLYRKIINIIDLIDSNNVLDYYFNTNAVELTPELSKRFIDVGLPRISISVGGWDKRSFEECQVGAKFETVLNNVKQLKQIRDAQKAIKPKIRIQAVLKPELYAHFEEFKNLWGPFADEIGGIDFREETTDSTMFNRYDDFKCNFLWQRLVVLWDGSVYPCLFHGVKNPQDILLGNVRNTTLKELWHSQKMNYIRQLHSTEKSYLCNSCVACSYRKTEILKKLKEKEH